ncbi:MAG TPA: hypothetical protein VHB53_00295 [Solirubrobacterales bacterium]|nr:hypothetical protein [Solirubrobacterales bacterium]
MDERDQKRQLVDAKTEGTGRLRGGVEMARAGIGRAWLTVGDAGWLLRERIAWPVEDGLERLGTRGAIGVFGGGGIALAGVVAALAIASSGGSGSSAGTMEAFVTPRRAPAPTARAPKPKKQAVKPTGPTLHGAPPDFSPAKDVRAGVADGKALGGKRHSGGGDAPATRGAASDGTGGAAAGAPASTAKIGATPEATAAAQAQASSLATDGAGKGGEKGGELTGPPAPKAAKKVARRFAEAFVVYEVGGIDGKVREAFDQTSTKQLSRSLLQRPPRQPAGVKVPQAKVVNVVAGPSKGSIYTVSVSLLRVGVTSELRLEMEQGVGKKWQVTNVLG